MRNVILLIIGVAVAGCASARHERAAEFQRELPELVAACNGLADAAAPRGGFNACRKLAVRESLGLADPAAARAYMSAMSGAGANQIIQSGASAITAVPMPLPQVQ